MRIRLNASIFAIFLAFISFPVKANDDLVPIIAMLLFDSEPDAIYQCSVGKVKELNQPASQTGYQVEANFIDLGDITLFAADTVEHGIELWRTDGTEAGTFLLKDINPGSADGLFGPDLFDEPFFTRLGDKVLFAADNGVNRRQLWITDGTPNGTRLLKVLDPAGSDPNNMTILNNKVYFMSNTPSLNTNGLWVTDGTSGGTRLVRAGTERFFHANAGSMVVLNNQLIFPLKNKTIWRSNGTSAGTVQLKSFDGSNFYPREFTAVGGKVFFHADTTAHGRELWVSDGTASGTRLVRNINTNNSDNGGDGVVAIHIDRGYTQNPGLDGKLYFVAYQPQAGNELWVSDGTFSGTRLAVDTDPGTGSGMSSLFNNAVVFNNAFYFLADSDLWKVSANGSASRVSDVGPSIFSRSPGLVASEQFMFMTEGSVLEDRELRIMDKNERFRNIDIFPGEEPSSHPSYFHVREDQSVLFITTGDSALYQLNCPSGEE